jgi:hypothetical protein
MYRATTGEGGGFDDETKHPVDNPNTRLAALPPDRRGLSLLIEASRDVRGGPGDGLLLLCTAERTYLPEDCENPFSPARRGLWLLAEAARYSSGPATDAGCAQSPIRLGMGLASISVAEREAAAASLSRAVEHEVRRLRNTGGVTFDASIQRMIAAGAHAASAVAVAVARQTARNVDGAANDYGMRHSVQNPTAEPDLRKDHHAQQTTQPTSPLHAAPPARSDYSAASKKIDFASLIDPFVPSWNVAGVGTGTPGATAVATAPAPAVPVTIDEVLRRAAAAANGVGARGHIS